MSITFPPDIEHRLTNLVDKGRFENSESALREAIRLLEEQDQQNDLLIAKLQIGIDQADRGELIEWTPAHRQQLHDLARQRVARGEKPNPDVCP